MMNSYPQCTLKRKTGAKDEMKIFREKTHGIREIEGMGKYDAYLLATLFDIRGRIHCRPPEKTEEYSEEHFAPEIEIWSKDKNLKIIWEEWGGCFYEPQKYKRYGWVLGQWRGRPQRQRFLQKILPFLQVNNLQAALALKMLAGLEKKTKGKWTEKDLQENKAWASEMKRLNHETRTRVR